MVLAVADQHSDIRRQDGPTGGTYRLAAGGSVAEMTFSRASQALIIIDHTEVPEAMRGQGAGNRLVSYAVQDARDQGFKIFPLCPFAAAQFRKHPEYADVLSK
jgi:predicted GNAT family acetyltransferase